MRSSFSILRAASIRGTISRQFSASQGVVVLDYNALKAGEDLSSEISRAYGAEGLGILKVDNVPGVLEKRAALLPLARKFADLPQDVLAKYEHAESFYSFGWSHGKEKLQGLPDFAKGSFYANPQYDRPVDDEALIKQFTPFIHPNIWPTEEMPELEHAFKEMGQLIVHVGEMVAAQCDRFVKSQCPEYEDNKLHRIINTSKCCKARLLHYFPLTEGDQPKDGDMNSSWCGWHNDHGSLTGLTPNMYIDADGNPIECPDPDAGLYIKARSGDLVKATLEPHTLGFQIGETAQIHSGGLLQATPHAVRGGSMPGITRETFAVFMEPNWDESMNVPPGRTSEEAHTQSSATTLPPGVPRLDTRWSEGMDFNDFTQKTLNALLLSIRGSHLVPTRSASLCE